MQVIGIVFKVGGISVGRGDGTPVVVQPLLTVINAHIFDGNFSLPVRIAVFSCKRHHQVLYTVGGEHGAAVSKRLLYKMFVCFQHNGIMPQQYAEVSNGGEVVKFDEAMHGL